MILGFLPGLQVSKATKPWVVIWQLYPILSKKNSDFTDKITLFAMNHVSSQFFHNLENIFLRNPLIFFRKISTIHCGNIFLWVLPVFESTGHLSVDDDGIVMTLELHQPCQERLPAGLLRYLFDEIDNVFGLVGGQMLTDLSARPIQNEIDFLRLLINNHVCLHGMDSFDWSCNSWWYKMLQSKKRNLFAISILPVFTIFT